MISVKKIYPTFTIFLFFFFQFIPLKKDEGFNFPSCSKIEENNLFSSLSHAVLFVCLFVFVFTTKTKTRAINFNFDCLVSFHFHLNIIITTIRELGLQQSKVKTLLLQRWTRVKSAVRMRAFPASGANFHVPSPIEIIRDTKTN